jgi:non-structural maintenance of chromosomes element 1
MPDIGMMNYNDSNRAFVQAFLARNTLTLETAKPLLAAIFSVQEGKEVLSEDITQDDLNSYVAAAHTALSPLDYEIRSAPHQKTRERVYALVNTTSDPLTQLATSYSADEMAFVKRLLDAMFDGPANKGRKEAMCLSAMEAVQLARSGNRRETQNGATQPSQQNLSMREAEDMLAKLVDEGWLEKSRAGFYTLSPRALMELKGWLVDTYNEPAED